jgi:hypothetical protein
MAKKINDDLINIKNLMEHYFGVVMEVIGENNKIIYLNKKSEIMIKPSRTAEP